jgi:hypothetical protein
MSRRYRPLATLRTQPTPAPAARVPAPRFFPAGRYARMNPLLRWCSLQVLAAPLPDPLRASLIRAWQHPGRYNGEQAIQNLFRQRYAEESLPFLPPSLLGTAAQVELEVGRRIVELPRTEITSEARSRLLRSQGVYLSQVYAALCHQLGEAAALAAFEQRLRSMR